MRPGRSVRPKIRLTEYGPDLISILRCFLSFETVLTTRNIIVFKTSRARSLVPRAASWARTRARLVRVAAAAAALAPVDGPRWPRTRVRPPAAVGQCARVQWQWASASRNDDACTRNDGPGHRSGRPLPASLDPGRRAVRRRRWLLHPTRMLAAVLVGTACVHLVGARLTLLPCIHPH